MRKSVAIISAAILLAGGVSEAAPASLLPPIQTESLSVESDRADIIRRVNRMFGGDCRVSVTGVERKDIYFQLDLNVNDVDTAREIAVGAVYEVLDHFYDYDVNFVQVITTNRRAPLGIVNWWSDSGFEYLGGFR